MQGIDTGYKVQGTRYRVKGTRYSTRGRASEGTLVQVNVQGIMHVTRVARMGAGQKRWGKMHLQKEGRNVQPIRLIYQSRVACEADSAMGKSIDRCTPEPS